VTRPARALLLCLACGCSAPAAYDAPGTYEMDRPFVADTLWVLPDGTYTLVYAPDGGGKTLVVRGRWEYVRNERSITFHGFPVREYSGSVRDASQTGVWRAPFQRTAFGSIVLQVYEDKGLQYRRVSPDLLGSAGRGR
jgi:hypothetical protein